MNAVSTVERSVHAGLLPCVPALVSLFPCPTSHRDARLSKHLLNLPAEKNRRRGGLVCRSWRPLWRVGWRWASGPSLSSLGCLFVPLSFFSSLPHRRDGFISDLIEGCIFFLQTRVFDSEDVCANLAGFACALGWSCWFWRDGETDARAA